MALSLHKVGAAYDLFMAAEINRPQRDPTKPNYYPTYFSRKYDVDPWVVYGLVREEDVKEAPDREYVTSALIIEPWEYDPSSPTGGGKTIAAEPGHRFLNISKIAAKHGIHNIGPHTHGWKGGGSEKFVFWDGTSGTPAPFGAKAFNELMRRLEEQMNKESFSDKAEFVVNDTLVLSSEAMKHEYEFLKRFYAATQSLFPTPTVFFKPMEKPAKDPVFAALYGVSATFQKRQFLVEWGGRQES